MRFNETDCDISDCDIALEMLGNVSKILYAVEYGNAVLIDYQLKALQKKYRQAEKH